MKKIKAIVLIVFAAATATQSFAQQLPMYTHYMYNTLSVNPAYAGSREALTVTALHRSQWVNFKGAPITQTLTMHAPIINEHIGVGLSVMNDKIGPTNNTAIFGSFAYIMKLSKRSKLALGLSAGASIFQARLTSLELDQQNDPAFQSNVTDRVNPNFGFGAYYYHERFYAGISVPNLLQNPYSAQLLENGDPLLGREKQHYFFIAGGLITLSPNLDFKPTTLVKVTEAAPAQADLTASFVIALRLLLGAMFRTNDAVGALIGYDITQQLHAGYSYDWSFGLRTFQYNGGSHELMLRYDFIYPSKKQVHSPRYF
jgi:type IX secretion system PorP/SprF family membrane protein